MKSLIAQGAEAKLFLISDLKEKKIIKDRFRKKYRIKELDDKLRRSRTKRECKVLNKLALLNFPAPRLIDTDDKEKITIEFIKGPKIRDILEQSDYKKLCKEIGRKIAILHTNNMIHSDLTTSNMIFNQSVNNQTNKINEEIYFIDFGLSFFSHKTEDKAVDLHLLKQALESKHYAISEQCFKCALDGYKKGYKDSADVLKRLELVEKRGRYKNKK